MSDSTIYPFFQKVVAAAPDAVAIGGRPGCSFAELDRRARANAAQLTRRARPEGQAVAVLLGADAVAEISAILGVIAAGGVAVPLESHEPAGHLARVVEKSQSIAVLAAGPLLPLATQLITSQTVIEIAGDTATDADAVVPVAAEAPAYLCYTSGSTGEPKGVFSTHRKTVTNALAGAEALGYGRDDRHTLLHSLSLGSGRATLFRALLSGGAVLPRRVKEAGVADLRSWLEAEAATVLFCSPTLYRTFLAGLGPTDRLTTIRMVRLVGERVLPDDLAAFKRHFRADARFVVAYSITEAGNITQNVLTHESPVPPDVLSVGLPVRGRRVRIVDENGAAVPVGATGEIVVDGVPNDFKTGDLGCLDADGRLYHLGRRDFQVKIRGFRVELEGVEATLVRAPGVTQAGVIAKPNVHGELALVAFVAGDRRLIDGDRLRAFAERQLPNGSVPGRFVVLDALPLTGSGKIDRRALAALDDSSAAPSLAAPTTASSLEAAVAACWRDVLGHDRFGIDDGFLRVGGDSLLAMRMLARIRQRLDAEIPLQSFLSSPTISGLATAIESRRQDERRAHETRLAALLDEAERRTLPQS